MLYSDGNQRFRIVVYENKNKSSWCPLRIDFKIEDKNNFSILFYDQSGEKTIKKEFFVYEYGKFYSDFENYDKVKLSELLNKN